MALFEPDRHDPLCERPWSVDEARSVAREISSDALSFGGTSWPTHDLDRQPGIAIPDLRLYSGTIGVIWALDYLQKMGVVERGRDWRPDLASIVLPELGEISGWRASRHSYLMGDSSLLLLNWKLTKSAEVAVELAEAIRSNLDDTTHDLMWSTPGTTLASIFMHEWTGDQQWRDLFLAGATVLWETFKESDEVHCRMWTQNLYGHQTMSVGAVHGFAGNAFAIIRGLHLLTGDIRDAWQEEIVRTLSETARREGGMANWPQTVGAAVRPGRTALLLQHCHGAPGIVTCLAKLPSRDPGFETLLREGCELTWKAGPLSKGSNLCHGTAGNAYAFLKYFERTGDQLWLDRARAFAMHAIEQWRAAKRNYGMIRYSLWTGDLGLAAFLCDCIDATARFPTIDVF